MHCSDVNLTIQIQTASFLVFFSFLSTALYRSRRLKSHSFSTRFSLTIVATSILIFLRTVFRLAETAQGVHFSYLTLLPLNILSLGVFGTAFSSETLFGCLEYLPVILAVWIWALNPLDVLLRRGRPVANESIQLRDKTVIV